MRKTTFKNEQLCIANIIFLKKQIIAEIRGEKFCTIVHFTVQFAVPKYSTELLSTISKFMINN